MFVFVNKRIHYTFGPFEENDIFFAKSIHISEFIRSTKLKRKMGGAAQNLFTKNYLKWDLRVCYDDILLYLIKQKIPWISSQNNGHVCKKQTYFFFLTKSKTSILMFSFGEFLHNVHYFCTEFELCILTTVRWEEVIQPPKLLKKYSNAFWLGAHLSKDGS